MDSSDTWGGLRRGGADEIEAKLRALRNDTADWNIEATGGRWSLGGAQGKFALSRAGDGAWSVPTGRAASTHIFKVGPVVGANGTVAEHVTSRIARLLGIASARTDLCRFGKELAVVSERFDRRLDESGVIHRLHQEDLCQAMGMSRALKYQADGGPSVSEVKNLFQRVVDPRDLKASRELFAKALVFNWLVAGTDAHAKNYSLIHLGVRVRLAPLYDLTSGAMMFDPEKLHYHGELAMKLGGEYRFRQIGVRHLRRAAVEVGVDSDWIVTVAEDFTQRLPGAFDQALNEISNIAREARPALRLGFTSRLEHAEDGLRDLTAAGLLVDPAEGNGHSEASSGEIWVSPHVRNGAPIAGHWRKRPGRR